MWIKWASFGLMVTFPTCLSGVAMLTQWIWTQLFWHLLKYVMGCKGAVGIHLNMSVYMSLKRVHMFIYLIYPIHLFLNKCTIYFVLKCSTQNGFLSCLVRWDCHVKGKKFKGCDSILEAARATKTRSIAIHWFIMQLYSVWEICNLLLEYNI